MDNYIFFNNILVRVDSIDTVERTDDNHLIVTLRSGRTLDNTYPSKDLLDKHQQMFMDLLKPADFDVVPTDYKEINAKK